MADREWLLTIATDLAENADHPVSASLGAQIARALLAAEQEAEALRRERDERTCADCGIPEVWCRRVSSDVSHCWRWDYERFDELMTDAERRARELEEKLERIRAAAGTTPLVSLPWILKQTDLARPASEPAREGM